MHKPSYSTTASPEHRYQYNGKERDPLTDWIDYGARWYDPAIARWGQVDPLAEAYHSMTPYNYVTNNPMNTIGPDGRWAQQLVEGGSSSSSDGSINPMGESGSSDDSGYENGVWVGHESAERPSVGKDDCCPDPPYTEQNMYYDMTVAIQEMAAVVASWFDGLFVSYKTEASAENNLKTSVSVESSPNLEATIRGVKPDENGEAVFSNVPLIKTQVQTSIYYENGESIEIPLKKPLSASVGAKIIIDVTDPSNNGVQVKGSIGAKRNGQEVNVFHSSKSTFKGDTKKTGVEYKAGNSNAKTTFQFGYKSKN